MNYSPWGEQSKIKEGALIGALFGGIGGIGQVLGQSCKVLQHLGKIAKIIPTVSKISVVISLGMVGFGFWYFKS